MVGSKLRPINITAQRNGRGSTLSGRSALPNVRASRRNMCGLGNSRRRERSKADRQPQLSPSPGNRRNMAADRNPQRIPDRNPQRNPDRNHQRTQDRNMAHSPDSRCNSQRIRRR